MTTYNLKNFQLFEDCDDSFIENLESSAHEQMYDKGKVLFIHEDVARSFFIIKSGWVKLYRETIDGTQAIVDILPKDHIFGETSIFDNDIYPYTAEVIEPSEIISYPLVELKNEINTNNKIALAMLNSMAKYRRQLDKEIEHRTLQNAAQRIGCFLLRIATKEDDGRVRIHLPYDKTLVALRLGMQPETFSRALAKLREKTGIKVKGATIELERLEQLSDYCCAACSTAFPCNDLDILTNKTRSSA